jgi:hypothetical protein
MRRPQHTSAAEGFAITDGKNGNVWRRMMEKLRGHLHRIADFQID